MREGSFICDLRFWIDDLRLRVLYQGLGEGGWRKKEERRKRARFVVEGGGRAYNLEISSVPFWRGVQVPARGRSMQSDGFRTPRQSPVSTGRLSPRTRTANITVSPLGIAMTIWR